MSQKEVGSDTRPDPLVRASFFASHLALFSFPLLLAGGMLLPAFRVRMAQLCGAAWRSIGSRQYRMEFVYRGAVSGTLRSGYDLLFADEETEIRRNVAGAFLFGGLCGGLKVNGVTGRSLTARLLPLVVRYHYVGLDILGDACGRGLTNIREKLGDVGGIGLSLALIGLVNFGGIRLISPLTRGMSRPRLRVAGAAAIMLGFDAFLEAQVQTRSGKDWREIDTGRLVGANVWGYMGVLLPFVILKSAPQGNGFTDVLIRASELALKNLLFVAPSLNNVNARLNRQNWENVQIGHGVRYATMMWPAQLFQSRWLPLSPLSLTADYFMSVGGSLAMNERLPFYEGVPEMWREGLLQRVRALREEGNFEKSCEALTDYLVIQMGRRTGWLDPEYEPVPGNLRKIGRAVRDPDDWLLLRRYLDYLAMKPRTRQEEMILAELAAPAA